MLGQWRIIVLKQAQESAKAGRFDEALALTNRSGVSDHRLALKLRARLALDLLARAERRAAAEDAAGAIDDLSLAESAGAAPDLLAAARLKLAERVAVDVKNDLDAGEPIRVVDRVEYFARQKIGGPTLRRAGEAAEAWRTAGDESRRGEFGRAFECLDRAERLAGESAKPAIDATRREVESRQRASQSKIERFYVALADHQPMSVLAAAEEVLAIVPEHPAAREARTKAWRQIGAIHPANSSLPARPLLGRAKRSDPIRRGAIPSRASVSSTTKRTQTSLPRSFAIRRTRTAEPLNNWIAVARAAPDRCKSAKEIAERFSLA